MPTNPAGAGKEHVSTSVDNAIAAEIARRAETLGITKGAYLRLILEKWQSTGFPPVSKPDQLLQQASLPSDRVSRAS
jgi:hypothetical protein